MSKRRKWTAKDIKEVMKRSNNDETYSEIAKKMNRSENAIRMKLYDLAKKENNKRKHDYNLRKKRKKNHNKNKYDRDSDDFVVSDNYEEDDETVSEDEDEAYKPPKKKKVFR